MISLHGTAGAAAERTGKIFGASVAVGFHFCTLAIQNVLEKVEYAEEAEKEESDDGVLSTHSDDACTHGGHNDDESDND